VFEVKGPAHKYAPALFACLFVAPAYRFVSIGSVTDFHNMQTDVSYSLKKNEFSRKTAFHIHWDDPGMAGMNFGK
jgi:hypothetical protein